MTSETDEFFEGKRPWSLIKDSILAGYMNPYMAKIASLSAPILLIDAFAGPGKFDDGKPGSPLIMCQAAKKYAEGRCEAIFVNKERKYHEQLEKILKKNGYDAFATSLHGDSREFLKTIPPMLKQQSVFLYLDPFGLTGDFSILKPFIDRNPTYSTELLINLSAPILHRMAARDAYLSQTGDLQQIASWHDTLTRTFGGDYWKEAFLTDNHLDAKAREQLVIEGYKQQLARTGYLTYTGSCPIQATREGRTKYYMIFASRHPDSMVLFNDEMCKSFNSYMNETENQDTLFADLSWKSWRDTKQLEDLIVEYVAKYPNATREKLWLLIVKDHFMRFLGSEYRQTVTSLVEANRIQCTTPIGSKTRKTKRLNDACELAPI